MINLLKRSKNIKEMDEIFFYNPIKEEFKWATLNSHDDFESGTIETGSFEEAIKILKTDRDLFVVSKEGKFISYSKKDK